MDGRDSSLAAEDGRSSPVTDALAAEAEALFSSGRFSECVEVLNQLLAKKEGDPKILHNVAVAEFKRDGCSDPKKLLDTLDKVKKRNEELARSSGDQVDAAGNLGNNATGSKESGTNLHQLTDNGTSSMSCLDQFDTSLITVNIATVLYQLHEYAHALSILEPLYQNIDPIDETTALHVCLLLLDIALASHDVLKAADVIHYLEKCFGVGYIGNQSDNGNTTQHQVPKASISMPEVSSSDSSSNANINDNSLSGTLSDDALEYENLYSTLDGSGQNLGRAPSNRAAPATDLKLKIQIYKVRLLLLTRNYKTAKREVKLAMNMARGKDSSAELLLKAEVEFTRGNYKKASKLLMASTNKTEPQMLSFFNNNHGCILYKQKGHHASGLLFSKALRISSSLRGEKPRDLITFSQDKSLQLMYNLGVQNLTIGKPTNAGKCFAEASLEFYNKPLLWLRLAECCLMALEKGILELSGEEIKVHVLGSGNWRKLAIDDLNTKNGYIKDGSGEESKLSLPFARYCLQNALLLMSINKKTSEGDSESLNGDSKESKGLLQSSVAAYEDMQREDNHKIHQAVLGNLAYVEIKLENYVKALSLSKTLLDLQECSKIYIFLGHLYAAEALCRLNRTKEAEEHLLPYIKQGGELELPYGNEDIEKWNTNRVFGDSEDLKNSTTEEAVFMNAEEGRGVMLVNLSVIAALQGDVETASRRAAEALSKLPNNPRGLLNAIYIDLLQEKPQDAVAKLKQYNNVRYLPADVKMRS